MCGRACSNEPMTARVGECSAVARRAACPRDEAAMGGDPPATATSVVPAPSTRHSWAETKGPALPAKASMYRWNWLGSPPVACANAAAEVRGIWIDGIASDTTDAACRSCRLRSRPSLRAWIDTDTHANVPVRTRPATSTPMLNALGRRRMVAGEGCDPDRGVSSMRGVALPRDRIVGSRGQARQTAVDRKAGVHDTALPESGHFHTTPALQ